MHDLTAAHRTLPFNTIVRVERLDERRAVQVRINDRGPFIEGRVIDLSRESARRLGLIEAGVAPVRLFPVQRPSAGERRWAIRVGEFARKEDALKFSEKFAARWRNVRVVSSGGGSGERFHLQLQGFGGEEKAREMLGRLRGEGYTVFLTAVP